MDEELAARYPEHEKLGAVHEQSQVIGEFLDHCGYRLCKLRKVECEFCGEPEDAWVPVGEGIQAILADYFEIDLDVLEAEKRAMLDVQRKLNEKRRDG